MQEGKGAEVARVGAGRVGGGQGAGASGTGLSILHFILGVMGREGGSRHASRRSTSLCISSSWVKAGVASRCEQHVLTAARRGLLSPGWVKALPRGPRESQAQRDARNDLDFEGCCCQLEPRPWVSHAPFLPEARPSPVRWACRERRKDVGFRLCDRQVQARAFISEKRSLSTPSLTTVHLIPLIRAECCAHLRGTFPFKS